MVLRFILSKERLLLIIFIVFALMNPLLQGDEEKVAQYENIKSGVDPRGFNTAQEMYNTAAVKAYDQQAGLLVSEMNNLIKDQSLSPESNTVRALLRELNPYRKSAEVQEAVQTWKTLWVIRLKTKNYPSPKGSEALFKEANRLYNTLGNSPQISKENQKAANQKYLEIVSRFPLHLDARNNLALTDLHMNQDLRAQLELEILRDLSPDYVPALINLTVVYERLGLSSQAKKIAHNTRQKYPKMPQAVYNSAWFLNWAGKFKETRDFLKPLLTMNFSAKAKKLDNQNTRMESSGFAYPPARVPPDKKSPAAVIPPAQKKTPADTAVKPAAKKQAPTGAAGTAKKPPVKKPAAVDNVNKNAPAAKKGFWQKGLAGVLGGKTVWWSWVLSIIGFLFFAFLAAAIWSGITSSKRRTSPPFLSSVIAGGVFYILIWGAPTGWAWVPLIIFALIFFGVVNETIKNM